jgi:hypothetical protein
MSESATNDPAVATPSDTPQAEVAPTLSQADLSSLNRIEEDYYASDIIVARSYDDERKVNRGDVLKIEALIDR